MSRCGFCGHGTQDGKPPTSHDVACPMASGRLDESKKTAHQAGWNQGRSGKKALIPDDPTYKLGWLRGDAALEEATSGCDRPIH